MVDISDAALAVSKENLRRNRQNRTICLKADALEKPPMSIGTFDIIVSNPPYVASMDILTLDSSVRDYEPLARSTAARTADVLPRHRAALDADPPSRRLAHGSRSARIRQTLSWR